jgi:vancomycin resistance protein YoaR
MKKFFGGLAAAAVLGLMMPAVTSEAAQEPQIAKGVFIGPIDVSGMDMDEAEKAVSEYVDEMAEKTIILHVDEGKEKEFCANDIDLYWSNTGIVQEAYALGHQGNLVERYKALKDLENNKHVYELNFGYDEEAIASLVAGCAEDFDQETINCTLKKDGSEFVITEGQTGYLVDRDASKRAIEDFLEDSFLDGQSTINLVVEAQQPKGTKEELSRVRDVLGTFTTSYSSSGSSRSANVANGCSLINGSTVYPGEEFSVLDTITPFTRENGYYPAGSYLNGVVVESIGGGICQVSTTLYNAVLLAELDVTERHNHSMIVNYVDPSADAAIAESGGKNFRFVNSLDHPIYIEGSTSSDKRITFTIYGVEERNPSRKVSYQSEVLEKIPASADRIVTDGGHSIGYVGTQSAHLGYRAQLWKIVTENGETTKEVVNTSTYKMVPRIVTVGTGGADETSMAQLQTALATGDLGTIKAVAGAIAAARGAAGTEGAEAANQAVADATAAANAQLQQQAEAAAAAAAAENPQPEAAAEAPAAEAPAPEAPPTEAAPAAEAPAAQEPEPVPIDTAEVIETD